MTPTELSSLEALAKAATPGPWQTDGVYLMHTLQNGQLTTLADCCPNRRVAISEGRSNAAYIAAANPAAILSLIEEYKRMREALTPFAHCIDRLAPGPDIAHWRLADSLNHNLTVAHVLAARAALEPQS